MLNMIACERKREREKKKNFFADIIYFPVEYF